MAAPGVPKGARIPQETHINTDDPMRNQKHYSHTGRIFEENNYETKTKTNC